MKHPLNSRDLCWLIVSLLLLFVWFQEGVQHAKTAAERTANAGAWAIAVDDLPWDQQEALRKAHDDAYDHLTHAK